MKKILRIAALASTAALSLASVAMFAGCTTDYPQVTFTFEFNGTEYDVQFELTRKGAPQTVTHFLELVDTGYYNGTVIHDYDVGGLIYGGGYEMEDGGLVEKDYWSTLKAYEEAHNYHYTQSVFTDDPQDEATPLYTVYGEFSNNGVSGNNKSYRQNSRGTLVMYYSDKGDDVTPVSTLRSDGGANNEGNAYQQGTSSYSLNSATSMFYILTNSTVRTELDKQYCAFGRTVDFDQLGKLLDAINDYTDTLAEGQEFTEEQSIVLNTHDIIDAVKSARITATYDVPILPITIKKAVVDKF